MVENKKLNDVRGELTFEDKVIQKIIGVSLDSVRGLLGVDGGFVANVKNKLVNTDNPTDGVSVEVGKEQVAVDLKIIAEYGSDVREMFNQIKEVSAQSVLDMTGLKLVELNVDVIDVQTKEEYEKNSRSIQDYVSDAGNDMSEQVSSMKKNVASSDKSTLNRVE